MIYRTRTEIWSQNVISILDLKLVVKLLPNHSSITVPSITVLLIDKTQKTDVLKFNN